jgi:hypothetical protein
VNRALGVLTVGALLTLVIGIVGSGGPLVAVPLGVGYTVLGTVGFWWVRRRSVCSGAGVLASAGLLDGRPATSHWMRLGGLEWVPTLTIAALMLPGAGIAAVVLRRRRGAHHEPVDAAQPLVRTP